MEPRLNLLARLHKWAARQDENFLTDAFAHLLQHLLDEEPTVAIGLLSELTRGFMNLNVDEAKKVSVRTQVITGDGTPDIEIRTSRQVVIVEVKSGSHVSSGQLEKYRRRLESDSASEKRLVLLTRYPEQIDPLSAQPDVAARWYALADWLDQQKGRYNFKPVSAYLVQQFLDFLGWRNMTMGQVGWELGNGVRALRNFLDMLYEAAVSNGLKAQIKAYSSESGVMLDGGNYWAGINFDDPDMLMFMTWNCTVNKEVADSIPGGEVHQWKDGVHYGWSRYLNLKAEDVHFYARSRASQMQMLEEFIRESIEMVKPAEEVGEAAQPDDAPPTTGE